MSNGERQIVFVTGEPGIGKTAVADAFIDRAATEMPDIRIARGQCIEGYGSKEVYYPILEALAGLCRGDGGDVIVEVSWSKEKYELARRSCRLRERSRWNDSGADTAAAPMPVSA